MKRYELVKICEYLKKIKKLDSIYRVDDTVFKLMFDKKESIFFDMTKGNSYIFKKDDYKSSKIYSAPFDIVLKKRCFNSFVEELEVLPNNKILRFKLTQKRSYKSLTTFLQFEFTGRHTNAIICDENMIILEALRHIDKSVSFREIQNGLSLIDLPEIKLKEREVEIDDIKSYLYKIYEKKMEKKLHNSINQKLINIEKKIQKLENIKDRLPKEEELLKNAKKYQKYAELILVNLAKIKNYQKEIKLCDYDGNDISITLPTNAKTPAMAANIFYNLSKKAKQKATNIHIEENNLNSKIEYLQNLKRVVKEVKSLDELKLYFPKNHKREKREKKYDGVENFYFEGYKISLGKNEKANALLLKKAKMSDIWLHLKDISSTHVIIKSNKQEIPKRVLEFAAKLCVKFSTTQKSDYLVDYTQRRNVKIIGGAKVNYINYKTIKA